MAVYVGMGVVGGDGVGVISLLVVVFPVVHPNPARRE